MRYYILSLFFMASGFLSGQDDCTFSYLIDTKSPINFATGQFEMPNGNFLLTYSNYDGVVGFIEITTSGNIVNKFKYSFYPGTVSGQFEQVRSIQFDQAGNIFGCGFLAPEKKGFIFKLSPTYQLLASKYYDDFCFVDLELKDNATLTAYAIPSALTNTFDQSSILELNTADLAAKTTTASTLKYESYFDHIEFVQKSGGFYYAVGGSEASSPGDNIGVISKFDLNNQLIWTKSPMKGYAQYNNKYTHRVLVDAGSVIVSSVSTTKSDTSTRFFLSKHNADNGETEWITAYRLDAAKTPTLRHLNATSFGYILTGTSDSNSDINLFAIAVDKKGNLLWSKQYGASNGKELMNFSNTIVRNDYLYLYANSNSFSNGNNLWWMSVDKSGGFTNPDCVVPDSLSVSQQQLLPNTDLVQSAQKQLQVKDQDQSSTIAATNAELINLCECLKCELKMASFPDTIKFDYPDTLLLSPNVTGVYKNATYIWKIDNAAFTCLSSNCDSIEMVPGCSGPCSCMIGRVKLTVTDSLGCVVIDSTILKHKLVISDKLQIPNVFTPNTDEINDIFTAIPDDLGCMKRVKLIRIFNRWGKVVYQDVDLLEGDFTTGWDGKSDLNGEELSSDIYLYQIDVELTDRSIQTFKGEVLLVR